MLVTIYLSAALFGLLVILPYLRVKVNLFNQEGDLLDAGLLCMLWPISVPVLVIGFLLALLFSASEELFKWLLKPKK